jgi:hypothetical protein
MHLRSDYLIKYFQMLNFTGRGVLFEDNLSILTSSQFDCLKIKRFYREGEKKTKMGEIKAQVTQISRTLLAPAAVRSSWQQQPPPVEAPKGTFPSPRSAQIDPPFFHFCRIPGLTESNSLGFLLPISAIGATCFRFLFLRLCG